jgi:G3E family GTPase
VTTQRSTSDLARVTVVAGGPEAGLLASRLATGLTTGAVPERIGVIAEIPSPEPVAHRAGDGEITWITVAAVEGERTQGCACCRSRLDVVSSIRLLLERPRPVDRIIVLVGPERDVSTVNQTMLSDPDLQRLVELDGVVTTVDAVAMATRLAVELPVAGLVELQRLAVADRIMVSRAAEITDAALGRVMRSIRTVNRMGIIAAPALVPVDIGTLVDLHAWHGAPMVGPANASEPLRVEHDDDVPITVQCEVQGLLDPDAIDEWFDHLIAEYGPRLLRLQGAVAVRGEEHRVCCQGVRSFASSHSESEHLPQDRSAHSLVVVVGHRLDEASIRSSFLAALAD